MGVRFVLLQKLIEYCRVLPYSREIIPLQERITAALLLPLVLCYSFR